MKTQPGSVSEPAAESVALSPRRETDRVRIITETIVMVALAGALYLIKIFTLPQGGSITLGSMVPIFLLALRRGPRIGIIGGVALCLVDPCRGVYLGVVVNLFSSPASLCCSLAIWLLGLASVLPQNP